MICSMTAFARASSQGSWGMATWEIRSVNHRYFECSFKVPDFLRQLEQKFRVQLQQQLHRGKIECCLKFYPGEKSGLDLSLNHALVNKLAGAATEIKKIVSSEQPIDPMKLLAWPHVLQTIEEDTQELQQEILQLFTNVLAEMLATREREGAALKSILEKKLATILVIVAEVKQKLPQILANQRSKILTKMEEIKTQLDPQRLEQEMVLFAQRIDVAEELERLETHVKEVTRVLQHGGNVGKRLDFLMQELNREANTLASKSADISTTGFAVDLKVLIEEMREQVQNIV